MEGKAIYSDGHTARQYQCRVVVTVDTIHLYFTDDNSNFLVWNVSELQSCHLNGNSLNVKYGPFPHQSLECEGELAREIYKYWSKRSVIRQAEGLTFRRSTKVTILLVVVFFALGLFAWLEFIPWLGEKAADYVPVSTEISLGGNLAGVYLSQNEIDDSASVLLQQFCDQLVLTGQYRLKVTVIHSDEINAFALPGGRIFVYSGIIEGMISYKELVALLGHEATHVINRHSLKSICRSAATGIFIASLFGDITGISSGILSQADQFKELDYSRELETEADDTGLKLMIQNRVSGSGMLDLLNLLKKEGQSMPGMMKYLSTHPDTGARITNIQSQPMAKQSFVERGDLDLIFKKIKSVL